MGGNQELSRVFKINNQLGLHARPAALIVETANKYQAEIKIQQNDKEIDCKSILNLMTMAANQGSTLKFVARGADAEEALDGIQQLFENGFGEK